MLTPAPHDNARVLSILPSQITQGFAYQLKARQDKDRNDRKVEPS
jgi:hypothetical protein